MSSLHNQQTEITQTQLISDIAAFVLKRDVKLQPTNTNIAEDM